MQKVKEGELEKLGLLFERYHRMLYTFFYRLNRNQEESEDMVQEVFERILKYKRTFKGDGTFKTWLFHIARNLNYDRYRNQKKKVKNDRLDDWTDKATDFNEKNEAMKKEYELNLLNQSIERLPEDKKELIVLSKLQGMKYKDIGDIYEISEGTVKVRVFRALRDLEKEYRSLQNMDA